MKKLINIPTTAPDDINEQDSTQKLQKLKKKLFSLQNQFYAEQKHALLIVLQGMDASGKDGTIRQVFSCMNPQGIKVKSFKTPTEEEKSHDFLWRIYAHLPEKGKIQIFNRSQYEDIIYPAVHGELDKKGIKNRLKVIRNFENHLEESGTVILKFYLHISQKEQNNRLQLRKTIPEKRWKHNAADEVEAKKWDDYMTIYQKITEESKKSNPWIILPADDKWYRNYLVAKTIVRTLEKLKMEYPNS